MKDIEDLVFNADYVPLLLEPYDPRTCLDKFRVGYECTPYHWMSMDKICDKVRIKLSIPPAYFDMNLFDVHYVVVDPVFYSSCEIAKLHEPNTMLEFQAPQFVNMLKFLVSYIVVKRKENLDDIEYLNWDIR